MSPERGIGYVASTSLSSTHAFFVRSELTVKDRPVGGDFAQSRKRLLVSGFIAQRGPLRFLEAYKVRCMQPVILACPRC